LKNKAIDYLIYVVVAGICIFTSFRFPERILRHSVSFIVIKDIAAFLGTFIGFTGCMLAMALIYKKLAEKTPGTKTYFAPFLLGVTVFFALIFCFGPEIMFKLLRKFF
jgi:hypothetical protein